jgi:hypothetical protein
MFVMDRGETVTGWDTSRASRFPQVARIPQAAGAPTVAAGISYISVVRANGASAAQKKKKR